MATSKKRHRRPGNREPKKKQTPMMRLKGAWTRICEGAKNASAKQKAAMIGAIVGGVALITLMTVMLWPRPLKFTTDAEGNFVDGKNGITYHLAPLSFEPESWKKEPYARCGDIDLYQISDLNPERWLCEENAGVGSVWYASDIKLPTLSSFKSEKIAVCTQSEAVMALKVIDNESHVKAVVRALEEGEAVEEVPTANRVMRLKFSSRAYPRLLYDISYLECDEGNFLYDRSQEKCVEVGSLLVWYINRADMDPDENTLIDHQTENGKQTDPTEDTAGEATDPTKESDAQSAEDAA